MDEKQALETLDNDLEEIRKTGQQIVEIDALRSYLKSLSGVAKDSAEHRKLQHDSRLAHNRAVHETNLEMLKSVLEAGRTALTSVILINGGAAVALLAYLGNLLSKNPKLEPPADISIGLVLFASGVLSGAMASGSRYVSQSFYSKDWDKSGNTFNGLSILLALSAYVMFGLGVWAAYQAFS